MFWLSKVYQDLSLQQNSEKNQNEEKYWMRQAAVHGYPDALFLYASYFVNNTKSPEAAESLEFLKKAADGGHTEAALELGLRYYKGEGVEPSLESAVKYLKIANKAKRYALPAHVLGTIYWNYGPDSETPTPGIKKGKNHAMALHEEAAKLGSTDSGLFLGGVYGTTAFGVQNFELSARYYRDVANAGIIEGNCGLAMLKLGGYDLADVTPQQAVDWLQAASDDGNSSAQYVLACAYQKGNVIPRDLQRAAQLFQEVVNSGEDYDEAKHELALLLLSGKNIPQDIPRALDLLQAAANEGYPESQYILGMMCLNGEHMNTNEGLAVQLLEAAAENSHAQAMLQLSQMYLAGKGVLKDVKKAEYLAHKGRTLRQQQEQQQQQAPAHSVHE